MKIKIVIRGDLNQEATKKAVIEFVKKGTKQR